MRSRQVGWIFAGVFALATVGNAAAGDRGRAESRALRRCERSIAREGLFYSHQLNWKLARCVTPLGDCAELPGAHACDDAVEACESVNGELLALEARMRARLTAACTSVPVARLVADGRFDMDECRSDTLAGFVDCLLAALRMASAYALTRVEPDACALVQAADVAWDVPPEICTPGPTCGGDDGGEDPPPDDTCEVPGTCGGPENLACPDGQVCNRRDVLCTNAAAVGECVPAPATCPDTASPVCGCDGVTYASDCARVAASAVLAHDGACEPVGIACATATDCPAGTFCEFPTGDCGESRFGTCLPTRRDGCDLCGAWVGGEVCGCDFVTYENDCARIAAGVGKFFGFPCTF